MWEFSSDLIVSFSLHPSFLCHKNDLLPNSDLRVFPIAQKQKQTKKKTKLQKKKKKKTHSKKHFLLFAFWEMNGRIAINPIYCGHSQESVEN